MALQKAGLSSPEKSVKILGAYIGENEDVSEKLVRQSVKHVCLFRRLQIMGPSNLSLAMLQRCTIPRQDYFLRVHKPAATLKIAECFDAEISRIISHWFLATGDSLRLATLPQKMGGLGLTQSTLKQRYFFEAARRSIDEPDDLLMFFMNATPHTRSIPTPKIYPAKPE